MESGKDGGTKVFVSGATGFIGIHLVLRLVGMGVTVHAIYHSESSAGLLREVVLKII